MKPPSFDFKAPAELQWSRQQWQGLQWAQPGLRLRVEGCELHDARLRWQPSPEGHAALVQLSAAQLRLTGVELQAELSPSLAFPETAELHLHALRGLHGTLQAFVTDAAWILDAHIHLPVRGGFIDFDEVRVEHLGPDSAMGVSAGGLYIDAPRLARRYLYVFTGALPQGVEPEQRDGRPGRRPHQRGRLGLHELLDDVVRARATPGQWANPQTESALARSRVGGELQLGDGVLGIDGCRLHLAGHALGANRVSVSAAALAGDLVLRWPQLVAEGAAVSLGGLQGGCGRLDGHLELQLSRWWPTQRQAGLRPVVSLRMESLTLRELSLGQP